MAVDDLFGAGFHPARIGSRISLGQAETADPFARGELGQVFLSLRLRAIGIGHRHAERAKFIHFGENGAVGLLFQTGIDDAGLEFLLRVGMRGLRDQALVLGQLIDEEERNVHWNEVAVAKGLYILRFRTTERYLLGVLSEHDDASRQVARGA